ncbi:class I SAM-dependent methyltransferase [Aquipuribacter sp. MA13-6]|uniref:class I SAM-dependent methyltransferase n=1 Tax=unclassified Aquipuribacter TaxID=2635084 RepID=UPI003EED3D7C
MTPGPVRRGAPEGPQARSFGATASEYDRVRPGYPPHVVRWALGPRPRRVADLGAGTGKLTRLLLELGHDVVAVEPDPLMREQLVAVSPDAVALAGSGEALPLPDASVDAVLVAQAWHWMDHDRTSVEVARVLRPGGALVLMWNLRDAHHPVTEAITSSVVAHAPDLAARAGADTYAARLDVSVPDPRFTPDGTATFDSSLRYGVDDLVSLVATWSYVALSPARDTVLAEVRRSAEALAAPDGTVDLAQAVHAYRFTRA